MQEEGSGERGSGERASAELDNAFADFDELESHAFGWLTEAEAFEREVEEAMNNTTDEGIEH